MEGFVFEPSVEKTAEISQGVGYGVGKVDDIAVVKKLVLETKDIVGTFAGLLSVLVRLLVGDFLAFPDPAYLPLFVPDHGVDTRPHAQVKKRVLFGHVNNIKLNGRVLGCIFDTEKEPLRVTLGIDIVLEDQVVHQILALIRAVQVSRLEV